MTRNSPTKKAVTIGVTGNSGCGKSSVCDILRDKGAFIIDADKIAHDILLKDSGASGAYDEIVGVFGPGVLGAGGEIDRKRLGRVIFADDAKRGILVDITHKYIIREMLELKEKAVKAGYALIAMDAPLLIEAGLHSYCDGVWAVRAGYDRRLARVMRRDGLTPGDAAARLNAQTPFEELARHATAIIENEDDDDIQDLRAQIERELDKIITRQRPVKNQ